ncbi:MAG: HEAT repeat domain-containing protein [Verrucomicrobia bacterium]|nr:HEAT repeat domain-containing protein [Verrucomicrobiota bacterium]
MPCSRFISALFAVFALNASAGPASDLAAKMPADSAVATASACEAVLATGEAGLLELCAAVRPPGDEAGLPARFALGSLAFHASRPGAGAQRILFASSVLKGLAAASDLEVKRFLLSLLELAGGEGCVAPVAALLTDAALCDPAIATLEGLASPAADAALAKALANPATAKSAPLILALGRRGVKSAAPAIAARARKGDAAADSAALSALANFGLPDTEALVAALAGPVDDAAETARRSALRLRYARRLATNGPTRPAAAICREVLAGKAATATRIDALNSLAAISAKDALVPLQEAAGSVDLDVARAALRRLGGFDDSSVGPWLASRFGAADTDLKADILCVLRMRGDKAGSPAVDAGLADTNETVIAAAAAAIALLPAGRQVPSLVAALSAHAASPARAKPIADALGRIPGDDATARIASAVGDAASPDATKALLPVLAARRGEVARTAVLKKLDHADPAIRAAAAQALGAAGTPQDLPRLVEMAVRSANPEAAAARKALVAIAGELPADRRAGAVLGTWAAADAATRAKLVSILGSVGGRAAMDKVIATLADTDASLREAALRSLAAWSTPDAVPKLLGLATTAEPANLRIVALRGAIRLSRDITASAADRLAWIDAALKAATRAEEKREAVSALAELDSPTAVTRAAALLDDPDVPREGALALARMLVPEKPRKGSKLAAGDIAALRKALPHLPAGDVKSRVEKALPK